MSKSGIKIFASLCAALMATTANGQTRSGFEIGAELFDYNYRELVEGETVVRDDGTIKGMTLTYVETIGNGWFIRPRLGVSGGKVTYSSEDGTARVPQRIGTFDVEVGRDYSLSGGITLTPFTGINSRLLLDDGAGVETDLGFLGYDREIFYMYAPVGVTAGMPIGGGAKLHLTAQYNLFLGGDVLSKLSPVAPEVPNVELELKKGHGFETSAIASIPVGRHAFSFGPYLRNWNIGQSESFVLPIPEENIEVEFFEPKSRTRELGFKLSFSF